jgi:RNA polymerase sigma-70 factor (ECF subfamily)
MLLAMTRNEDTAADLTQETFLKALVALPSFNLSSAFYTWLYRIATNAALDRMRRARTAGVTEAFDDHLDHGDVDVPGAAAMAVDPARAAATKEELEKLLAALDDLKPDHRQILVLREIEELSYQEIADVLEIRIGTVMSRLFTARARLREVLAARHGLKV